QAVVERTVDANADDLAGPRRRLPRRERDGPMTGRSTRLLARFPAPAGDEHFESAADQLLVELALDTGLHLEELLETAVRNLLGDRLLAQTERGSAGPPRVLEREELTEPCALDELEALPEIGLGLAREPDDEIRRDGDAGPRGAQIRDQPFVVGDHVSATHEPEDPIGAGLHRQVQIRADVRVPAHLLHHASREVPRVRGHEAEPAHSG